MLVILVVVLPSLLIHHCKKASINFPNKKVKQQTLAKSWKGGFCCGSVLHIVSVSSSRFSSVLAVQSSPSMFTPHLYIHHIIIPSSQPIHIKIKIMFEIRSVQLNLWSSPLDTILLGAFEIVTRPPSLQVDVQLLWVCQIVAGRHLVICLEIYKIYMKDEK